MKSVYVTYPVAISSKLSTIIYISIHYWVLKLVYSFNSL